MRLIIRESPGRGLGVFAGASSSTGALIEQVPVLVFPPSQMAALKQTLLWDYTFEWADEGCCLALGLGSLYNHSFDPNAQITIAPVLKIMRILALRDIAEGEEIFIDYLQGGVHSALWFDPA